jgi:hypothetical protein
MATGMMDKGLYQAPMGLSGLAEQPELEIEIEDPEALSIQAGDIEIQLQALRKKQQTLSMPILPSTWTTVTCLV